MTANLVGGTVTTGTTQPIVPWVIGERATATLTDVNAGNTLVTYIAGRGFVPLDLASDYTTYAAAAGATTNVREALTTGLTGLAGKPINALVLHSNNTAAATLVTGTGTLTLNSGTILFTANTAAANATRIASLSAVSMASPPPRESTSSMLSTPPRRRPRHCLRPQSAHRSSRMRASRNPAAGP